MKIKNKFLIVLISFFCIFGTTCESAQAHTREIIGEFSSPDYKIKNIEVVFDESTPISKESIEKSYKNYMQDSEINISAIHEQYPQLFKAKLLNQNAISLEFNYPLMKNIFHLNTEKMRELFSARESLLLIQPITIKIHIADTESSHLNTVHTISFNKIYGGHLLEDTNPQQQTDGFKHLDNPQFDGQIILTNRK